MTLTTRLKGFPVTIYFDGVMITSVYIGTSAGVDVVSILSDAFLLDCYLAVTDQLTKIRNN